MYRLIYKSKNTQKLDKETFRDILYTSAQMNGACGVTGALLATHSHYLQFLEGEYEAVNDTFSRIVHDPRHSKVELIVFKPIDERLFSAWEMKGFGIFQLNKELEAMLKDKYGEEDGSVRFPREESASLSLLNDIKLIETYS